MSARRVTTRNMLSAFSNVIVIICLIRDSYCGLLTGDLRLKSTPLTINHHAPLVININNKNKPPLPPLSLPKPAKPPPLLDQLYSPSKLLSAVSPLKLPKVLPVFPPIIPPLLTKLPLLPLLPLPPIIPPIPLIPLLPPPLLKLPRPSLLKKPLIPTPLIDSLQPLKVPILGQKTPIEKAISKASKKISDLKKKKSVSDKLKKLFKRGSLTSSELNRFKSILLK